MSYEINKVINRDIHLQYDGTVIKLIGLIDDQSPGNYLKPFFTEIHKHILEQSIENTTLDITGLGILNSSGIREIVEWILIVRDLDERHKYTITIVYSSNYMWQESSVSTFKFLNPTYITKEMI